MLAQAPAESSGSRPQLAIIDTDIGDDIDDAFALALAVKSPELKILGVTTAYGDTELRARLVERYLSAIGRFDIPVVAGVKTKADNVFTQAAYARQRTLPEAAAAFYQQNQAQGNGAQGNEVRSNETGSGPGEGNHQDGVGFILDQIRAHPGQVTIIAIGPEGNLAAAIRRDAATFRKVKRVVLMGGSIERGYDGPHGEHHPPDAEWNINRDPESARILFTSGVPLFVLPLDSTQIHLEVSARERIFSCGSPLTDQLTLLYHQWAAHSGSHSPDPTLFDPVAVTYAIHPELCPAKPFRIEVDEKGFTKPVQGEPNAQVCMQSDERGFLDLLLSRVASGAPQ